MSEEKLIEKIKELRLIKPSDEYARIGRLAILSHSKRLNSKWELVGKGFFAESLNFAFSTVFAALFLVLMLGGAGVILKDSSVGNLPGVGSDWIVTEAANITTDIDIHLGEASYYAVAAKKTAVALNETSLNAPAHTSPLLIENEAKSLQFESPTNKNIDALLNQATL
ncbi:MAG: hypothetical protein HYR95_02550 [Candidatus Colwellbacteria bacterium]|nr:hypothetical protein [Candidatus Colwellbacteria bacterium]